MIKNNFFIFKNNIKKIQNSFFFSVFCLIFILLFFLILSSYILNYNNYNNNNNNFTIRLNKENNFFYLSKTLEENINFDRFENIIIKKNKNNFNNISNYDAEILFNIYFKDNILNKSKIIKYDKSIINKKNKFIIKKDYKKNEKKILQIKKETSIKSKNENKPVLAKKIENNNKNIHQSKSIEIKKKIIDNQVLKSNFFIESNKKISLENKYNIINNCKKKLDEILSINKKEVLENNINVGYIENSINNNEYCEDIEKQSENELLDYIERLRKHVNQFPGKKVNLDIIIVLKESKIQDIIFPKKLFSLAYKMYIINILSSVEIPRKLWNKKLLISI